MCAAEHLAHISEDRRRQSLAEHLHGTAACAEACLQSVKLGQLGQLGGLLHDAGKYTQRFQTYLRKAAAREDVRRGSVVHTFTGVRLLLEQYHRPEASPCRRLTAEVLAYAVGAHHGLFDCIDRNAHSGFRHRMERPDVDYEEASERFLTDFLPQTELARRFEEAEQELTAVAGKLIEAAQQWDKTGEELLFCFGLLARLLLSAVIEGDRRDTASFMLGKAQPLFTGQTIEMWQTCLERLEEKLQAFPKGTPINQARQCFSEQCAEKGRGGSGIYRLNLPTGAGKTLSALRFALTHARKCGKSRIIFTFPLLTILEQNAAVLREYIGDDSIVLEHHSNLIRDREDAGESERTDLLRESWDAPVIITTLVQLLNTLFSGQTGCVRRFHSLCDSVIVIDEVQTVPTNMLSLFNTAVNFLTGVCGATVVLCSATQPCLEQVLRPLRMPITDIVPFDSALWSVFRRTTIEDAGSRSLEGIADMAIDMLADAPSLLIVCNKKDEAAYLYRTLSSDDWECFHLSASMCPQHRRDLITALTHSLKTSRNGGRRTVCVSTQVIEAGVDISFACAIRLAAGMDSVIQTAGRVNRHREREEIMPVRIVRCENEDLSRLKDIERARDATGGLLEDYRTVPENYAHDLSGDIAIQTYYSKLYTAMNRNHMDYPLDRGSLYDLLSSNTVYSNKDTNQFLQQAFAAAGHEFHVFDEETQDVLVPYGEGAELITDLCGEQAAHDLAYCKTLLEKAKSYTVSLFPYQLKQLEKDGTLHSCCDDRVLYVEKSCYDPKTGFSVKAGQDDFKEV